MANFCAKCGKPLVEGEPCCCMISTNESIQQETLQTDSVTIKNEKKDYISFLVETKQTFLSITKKPVSSGRALVKSNNLKVSLAFIMIQGILSGLFSVIVASKIGQGLSKVGDSFSGRSGELEAMMKLPYFKGFMLTAILSIILTFALAAILFGVNMIFKNTVTYSQMVSAVSLRSIFSIYTFAFAILVFFINPFASILCFFGGNLLGMFVIGMSLPRNDSSVEFLPYILAAAFFIFMVVSIMIIFKSWTIYIPDALKGGLLQIQDLLSNPEKWLNSIF